MDLKNSKFFSQNRRRQRRLLKLGLRLLEESYPKSETQLPIESTLGRLRLLSLLDYMRKGHQEKYLWLLTELDPLLEDISIHLQQCLVTHCSMVCLLRESVTNLLLLDSSPQDSLETLTYLLRLLLSTTSRDGCVEDSPRTTIMLNTSHGLLEICVPNALAQCFMEKGVPHARPAGTANAGKCDRVEGCTQPKGHWPHNMTEKEFWDWWAKEYE